MWTGVPRPPMATPEERLASYLATISAQLPVSAPIRTAVRHGNAATEIVAAVDAEGVELVVMTTRGRTGVTRGLLGSVADRVVHSTELPSPRWWNAVFPGRGSSRWRNPGLTR